jgi:PadR family transcriptional regulator PadR
VAPDSAIVQRTLEMLVLKSLSLAPMHGWGIAQRIDQLSKGTFQVQQGSLYPALLRMKRAGWLKTEWRTTENNRRARYYLLTPVGRKQLGVEAASWEKASEAVNAFLRTTTLEGNT